MKEFSVTVEVRNNRLKERREALGINNAELCARAGVDPGTYGRLEKMQDAPISKKTEQWRPIALRLAEFFKVKPDDLFPAAVLMAQETRSEIKADGEELLQLTDRLRRHAIGAATGDDPEERLERTEMAGVLEGLVDELPPRLRKAVRLRFGLDGAPLTHDELGERLGVCGARAQQIVNGALRRLRHRATKAEVKALTAIDAYAEETA